MIPITKPDEVRLLVYNLFQFESKVRPSERPIPAKPTEAQQIEQNILQKKAKMSKKIGESRANNANRIKKAVH